MKIIDIDPYSLPSVPLSKKRELPDLAGIYFVICRDAKVVKMGKPGDWTPPPIPLYIGQSISLFHRWNSSTFGEHHKMRLFKLLKNVEIAYFDTLSGYYRSTANALEMDEKELISRWYPLFNYISYPEALELISPS